MKDFFYFCVTKKAKDEKSFLLECPTYAHIRSQFQNICNTIDLPNMLTPKKYGDLGNLLFNLFEHINKMLKQTN